MIKAVALVVEMLSDSKIVVNMVCDSEFWDIVVCRVRYKHLCTDRQNGSCC